MAAKKKPLPQPKLSRAQRAWLEENLAEQDQRYAEIVAAMEALGPQRDAWIEAFLARIQTRGFNEDGDRLRRIRADELPARGRRRLKVVV